jgi:hypothetical protein
MVFKSARIHVRALSIVLIVFTIGAFSGINVRADNAPSCVAKGQALELNNQQVLQWKSTTRNQFQARAHVQGQLIRLYSTHDRDHYHMKVQIGQNAIDTIEVIYNVAFGRLPLLRPGDMIEACGDYKTSNQRAGHYQPSPDGAILHWVHHSTNPRHDSGFVMVNGTVFGQKR